MKTIKLNSNTTQGDVKCSICASKSIVRVEYARLNLCANCFVTRFEKRILQANKKYQLFRREDKIAVGISGGKDSASLLVSLDKICKKIGKIELIPVLIDEGIDGYRNVAAKNAFVLCKKLGYKLNVFSYKELFGGTLDDAMNNRYNLKPIKDARPLHSCGYCGIFRKQSLSIASKKLGANKLALGHNADDIAQTLLMNLLARNTNKIIGSHPIVQQEGKEGLMPRIKPLAFNTEIECALYAVINKAEFHVGGCPYANESLRGVVKDFLNQVETQIPGTKINLVESAIELSKQKNNAKALKKTLKKCRICNEPSSDKNSQICRSCQIIEQLGFKRQADQHE